MSHEYVRRGSQGSIIPHSSRTIYLMSTKQLNRRRLIPFPAFSYAFIQRGVNHTRTLATWTLLQKSGLEVLSRSQVVRIICQRMDLSPKQARCILRHGDRKFWQIIGGMVYPEPPAALAALISDLKLARIVKRSKMYVPEVALRNLGQLRAHLALPVISRSPDQPTPRAYTAVCLRRSLNTVSVYRHWLRTSGFIFTQANYRRWPREYFDLGRGRFYSSEGRWLVQRLPDLVELNPANIFRVNKGSKNIQGVLNPGLLGYRFSPYPVPEQLSPRPPPSGPSRDAKRAVAESRESRRVIVPRILPQKMEKWFGTDLPADQPNARSSDSCPN